VLEKERAKQTDQGQQQNKQAKDKFDKERAELMARIEKVEGEKKDAIDAYMIQIEKVE